MNNNYELFKNRAIIIITSIVLIVLAIFIAAQTVTTLRSIFMPTSAPANTITVSGKGTATSTPDTITLSYGMSAIAATASTAQAKTTKIGNEALAFIKKNGIADADIKTTSYNITPNYVRKACGNIGANSTCTRQKLSGYRVSQSVTVKVTDLKNIETLLQGLGQIGVTNLFAGSPHVAVPTVYTDLARTRAITKARANAITLSRELGVHLGRLVRFSQFENRPVLYVHSEEASLAVPSPGPAFPLGENTYTSSVTLVYAIY